MPVLYAIIIKRIPYEEKWKDKPAPYPHTNLLFPVSSVCIDSVNSQILTVSGDVTSHPLSVRVAT